MKMRAHHKRRNRRTQKQKLAFGDAAKRRHARKAGRTGSIRKKQIGGT